MYDDLVLYEDSCSAHKAGQASQLSFNSKTDGRTRGSSGSIDWVVETERQR